MLTGNIHLKNLELDTILNRVADRSVVHAVFTDKSEAMSYLEALKKADLGIPVVISGIFEEIFSGCKGIDIKPHTIHFSLGSFGKTELLPEEDVLWITTMCGHHQVAPNHVKDLVKEVKAGKISPDEAGKELAKQCVCGIFNPARAAKIIKKMAEK